MKRCVIALLLVACLFSCAFAEEVTPSDMIGKDTKLIFIADMLPMQFFTDSANRGELTAEGAPKEAGSDTQVQTLNEGLLLLNAGRADGMVSLYSTAQYIAARNPELTSIRGAYEMSMCMLARADRQELISTLNHGIEGMIADGVMSALWSEHVTGVIALGEPSPVALPDNKDGLKLRVGVSGDIPPMDYVAADGTPAGFNTAMLSELAKRENLSVEIVQIDSGARFAALASDRIDLFFWQTRMNMTADNYGGSVEEYRLAEESSINCLTTVPYISEYAGFLFSKESVEKISANLQPPESVGIPAKLSMTSEAVSEDRENASVWYRYYGSMADALQALKEEKVNSLVSLPESVARYIATRDDRIASHAMDKGMIWIEIRMATLEKELLATLDQAVSELKADGTLDRLEEEHINATLTGKVTPVALPQKDGARTLRVVVTQDLPTLDYVAQDGQPEGFNIAVIAEIANRLGFNVELVKAESYFARVPLLEEGEADVLFWLRVNMEENPLPGITPDPETYGDLLSTQPCYVAAENILVLE